MAMTMAMAMNMFIVVFVVVWFIAIKTDTYTVTIPQNTMGLLAAKHHLQSVNQNYMPYRKYDTYAVPSIRVDIIQLDKYLMEYANV